MPSSDFFHPQFLQVDTDTLKDAVKINIIDSVLKDLHPRECNWWYHEINIENNQTHTRTDEDTNAYSRKQMNFLQHTPQLEGISYQFKWMISDDFIQYQ